MEPVNHVTMPCSILPIMTLTPEYNNAQKSDIDLDKRDAKSDAEPASLQAQSSDNFSSLASPIQGGNHIPSSSLYTTPIVTLIVGGPKSPAHEPHPVTFFVHAQLLTSCSPFFTACLCVHPANNSTKQDQGSLGWRESRTRKIYLPTERVEDVAFLLQWLYSGGTAKNRLDLEAHGVSAEKGNELEIWRWVVALQPGLECESIDAAVEKYLLWKGEKRFVAKKRKRDVRKAGAIQCVNNQAIDGVPSDSAAYGEESGVPASTPASPSGNTFAEQTDTTLSIPTAASLLIAPKNQHSDSTLNMTKTFPQSHRRPSPPALGPLIRLYILADKYAINEPALSHAQRNPFPHPMILPPSLKSQIISRIVSIRYLANVLPDRKDISRLWTSIPHDALGERGLKRMLVGLFAGLKRREVRRIFADEGEKWDAEFMREVLVERCRREKDRGGGDWNMIEEEVKRESGSLVVLGSMADS